ncbi:twin-arginine translocation signal domain-containing protein [Tistrella bauzanensis]
MDRRSFLKGSAAAGAAAAAVAASNFPAPAIAQGKIEWRMVTSWPKNFPVSALPLSVSPSTSPPPVAAA